MMQMILSLPLAFALVAGSPAQGSSCDGPSIAASRGRHVTPKPAGGTKAKGPKVVKGAKGPKKAPATGTKRRGHKSTPK